MNNLLKLSLISAIVSLPSYASAQSNAAPSNQCVTLTDTSAMQKNMGTMMSGMDDMMHGTQDPAMKAHMQNMHDQMAAMMANMKNMNGSLMHSGMMRGAMMQDKGKSGSTPSAAPGVTPADHAAHHPN